MATQLPQDFKEFLRLFEDEGVEYLLVGGYAVSYYGYPRATADMGVWTAAHPANAEKIVKALTEFGMASDALKAELFVAPGQVIRMGVPPTRLEIQTGISGVEFTECFARRCRADFGGVEVNVISLDDLKANKRASGRHKDLDDLEHLP